MPCRGREPQRFALAMPRRPGSLALHPAVLAAVLIVLINDQIFKAAAWFPALLSGKLSDVAGLFAFPVIVVSCGELLTKRIASARSCGLVAILTITVFSAAKISHDFSLILGEAWTLGLAPLRFVLGRDQSDTISFAQDTSDLLALPAAIASVMVSHVRRPAAQDAFDAGIAT